MIIELNKEKIKWNILPDVFSLVLLMFLIICAIGYALYIINTPYIVGEISIQEEIEIEKIIFYLNTHFVFIYFSSLICILFISFINKFIILKFKEQCLVCDKCAYEEEMICLNIKQVKNDHIGRYVCKMHKKPYTKIEKIDNEWQNFTWKAIKETFHMR